MTNFKSGSGNLDFDADDGSSSDDTESSADSSARTDASSTDDAATTSESAAGQAPDSAAQSAAGTGPETASEEPAAHPGGDDGETYPYFVRRSNVGDERDTRLEIHVRDKVADGEAEFRHALATELGTSDVSKTDAREFALLAAFRHPERVAALMREEGFDSLG